MHKIPKLDESGLRGFGLTAGGLFVFIFGFLLPWLYDANLPVWPSIISAALIACALISPIMLRPVYDLWMRFGLLLNSITTPVILGVFFFLILMPMAVVMRSFGRDSLRLKIDKNTDTYRITCNKRTKESMERPF